MISREQSDVSGRHSAPPGAVVNTALPGYGRPKESYADLAGWIKWEGNARVSLNPPRWPTEQRRLTYPRQGG